MFLGAREREFRSALLQNNEKHRAKTWFSYTNSKKTHFEPRIPVEIENPRNSMKNQPFQPSTQASVAARAVLASKKALKTPTKPYVRFQARSLLETAIFEPFGAPQGSFFANPMFDFRHVHCWK